MPLRKKRSGTDQTPRSSALARERRRKKRLRDAFIGIGVFLLVGLAVGLLLLFTLHVDAITLYEPVYQYQVTERISYRGMSELSFDDGVTTIKNGEEQLQLGTAPLYFEDRDAILLPQDMVLVLPERPLLARAERFSTLTYTDAGISLKRGDDTLMIGRGFLYDGQNQYVFLSEIELTWLDQKRVLSPLSSVLTADDNEMLVIDHDSGKAERIRVDSGRVLAESSNGYEVDLTGDKLTLADGTEALLFARPEVLEPLI